MIRLPGTGIPLNSKNVSKTSVVICGENPADIFLTLSEQLKDWHQTDLSWGCREFYFRNYSNGTKSINAFVGGLGSASVELILQEGALAGVRNFVLTGSCASLNDKISVGSLVLPQRVILRPGAFSEYVSDQGEASADTDLQKKLRDFFVSENIPFSHVVNLSTDAFYGIGAAYNDEGIPSYAGTPLKQNKVPASVALALGNPMKADSLDMECAPFFALGNLLADVNVAAVKAVSNKIPWKPTEFNELAIANALKKAVVAALDFALTL